MLTNPKPAPEIPTSNLEFSYLTFGSKFTSGKSQFDEFERAKLQAGIHIVHSFFSY
jgi:hypothetical protein